MRIILAIVAVVLLLAAMPAVAGDDSVINRDSYRLSHGHVTLAQGPQRDLHHPSRHSMSSSRQLILLAAERDAGPSHIKVAQSEVGKGHTLDYRRIDWSGGAVGTKDKATADEKAEASPSVQDEDEAGDEEDEGGDEEEDGEDKEEEEGDGGWDRIWDAPKLG